MKTTTICLANEQITIDLAQRPSQVRAYKSSALKQYAISPEFRLSDDDREFLHHLGFIECMRVDDILNYYYSGLSFDEKVLSIQVLANCGVIRFTSIELSNKAKYICCTFANSNIFKVVTGHKAQTMLSSNCRDLMLSIGYFAVAMPTTFTRFNRLNTFSKSPIVSSKLEYKKTDSLPLKQPNALYIDNDNNLVLMFVDDKNLSRSDIQSTQETWNHYKQIWGFSDNLTNYRRTSYADNVRYFYCK